MTENHATPGLGQVPNLPTMRPVVDPVADGPVAPVPPVQAVPPVEPVAPVVPLGAHATSSDLPVASPVQPALPTVPTTGLPVQPAAPVTPADIPAPPPVAAPVVPAVQPVAPPVGPVATAGPESPAVASPSIAKPADGPVMPAAASTPGVTRMSEQEEEERIILDDLLIYMVENGGSDLHLAAGSPPVIRVRGEMSQIPGYQRLTPSQLQNTMYGVMSSKQQQTFEERLELDFAYTVPGQARFRVNVMKQRGSVGAVMRTIPWDIKSLEALNLPESIGDFADLPRGFVLVTGPTGSGKSTTLAAIIDRANRTRSGHIITIEDPIEFLHQHRRSVVNQREVGEDTQSFKDALKHVLRQDPDIILVGELRDLETISVALTAAETGHLVFATLHTQSAQETITRIIDVFPPEQQQQVQTQLAASLQGVVCQTLCKTADGNGRQAALEIMVATPNIRALIREKKLQQIQSALQSGAKYGMQTLNQDLANHVLNGRISYEVGLEKCSDKEDFNNLVGGPEGAAKAAQRLAAQQMHQGMGSLGATLPPVS